MRNAFLIVGESPRFESRIEEAGVYPLTDKGNQLDVVIAGVMGLSNEARATHNRKAKTVEERLYSFGTDVVQPLSDWSATREEAARAYRGLQGIVDRMDSGSENGQRRVLAFAIDCCNRHGLRNVDEFEEWIKGAGLSID